MKSILKVVKYQLISYKNQTLTCFLIIALNIIISLVVVHLLNTSKNNSNITAGSIDMVALIWMFIIGVGFFKPGFKFILANGVSRKRFFAANVCSYAILAATWSIVVSLITIISRRFTNIGVLYEILYKNLNIFSITVWLFAAFFLLVIMGWFTNMIFYRSGNRMKLLISFALFAIGPVTLLLNILTDGKVFKGIGQFLVTTMGFSSKVPNPFIGAFYMLLLVVILCGFNFLLIRKAQIKD